MRQIILDTETTGLDPKEHEIIEFAGMIYEQKDTGLYELVKKVKVKIKPKNIEDLAIITTLARPAAKNIIDDFNPYRRIQ